MIAAPGRIPLDETVAALGDGTLTTLADGAPLFQLDAYAGNPIVSPADLGLTRAEDGTPRSGAVFNGGAELVEGRVVLLPRQHHGYRRRTSFDAQLGRERIAFDDYLSEVVALGSRDGVSFQPLDVPLIAGDGRDHDDFVHGIEDIRIVRNGSGYLLAGTGKVAPAFNGARNAVSNGVRNADRIALYATKNFEQIEYLGMVDAFDTRNAIPMLTAVDGSYRILIRFFPDIHLDVLDYGLDQLLRPAAHRAAWQAVFERRGRTRLFGTGEFPHEAEKIGPGTQLIETSRGWLMLYHAVGEISRELCAAYGIAGPIPRGYSICAALLAADDPGRVLRRTALPIYIPSAPYELDGNEQYPVDVPAVVFPVGAFVRGGKLLVYAGAGDKYVVLLSCGLERLVDYLWEHCPVD